MPSPEHQHSTEVKTGSLERAAAERAAELARNQEKAGEHYDESEARHSAEKARIEANAEAISGKEQSPTEQENKSHNQPPVITPADREDSYQQTMSHIRQEMPLPARAFSKIIHNPVVERVSDAVGSTVARPNAILSGSVCAFLLVLALYAHARYIGYSLTGSETIASFALGWLIGIGFDFLRAMIRGRR